jgi:hypothetical protein
MQGVLNAFHERIENIANIHSKDFGDLTSHLSALSDQVGKLQLREDDREKLQTIPPPSPPEEARQGYEMDPQLVRCLPFAGLPQTRNLHS